MYFSGYIALMPPPPLYNELPLGYTTMFRLSSQFSFINFEVELHVKNQAVSTDPRLCNFKLLVSKTNTFEFNTATPILCNKIRGINKWIFLSVGLNFLTGQAKLGLVYEDLGQIFKRSQIFTGITQM